MSLYITIRQKHGHNKNHLHQALVPKFCKLVINPQQTSKDWSYVFFSVILLYPKSYIVFSWSKLIHRNKILACFNMHYIIRNAKEQCQQHYWSSTWKALVLWPPKINLNITLHYKHDSIVLFFLLRMAIYLYMQGNTNPPPHPTPQIYGI